LASQQSDWYTMHAQLADARTTRPFPRRHPQEMEGKGLAVPHYTEQQLSSCGTQSLLTAVLQAAKCEGPAPTRASSPVLAHRDHMELAWHVCHTTSCVVDYMQFTSTVSSFCSPHPQERKVAMLD
jgi:hypothetical protein